MKQQADEFSWSWCWVGWGTDTSGGQVSTHNLELQVSAFQTQYLSLPPAVFSDSLCTHTATVSFWRSFSHEFQLGGAILDFIAPLSAVPQGVSILIMTVTSRSLDCCRHVSWDWLFDRILVRGPFIGVQHTSPTLYHSNTSGHSLAYPLRRCHHHDYAYYPAETRYVIFKCFNLLLI